MKNLLLHFVFLLVIIETNGKEEVLYVHVGQEVELMSPDLPESFYLSWFRDKIDGPELASSSYLGRKEVNQEEIWKDKLSFSGNKLIIKNIQEENYGTFVCRVKDSDGRIQRAKTIRLVKVQVSMAGESPLIPGDSLSLNCVVALKPKSDIYWLSPTGHQFVQVRKKAATQDSGDWTCVVGNKEFKYSVSVVDFSSSPNRVYTSTNLPLDVPILIPPAVFVKQITLKIEKVEWVFVSRANPTEQTLFVTLAQGGKKVHDRGLRHKNFTKDGDFSLYRNKATEEDRGSYNCFVTFTNGHVLNRTVVVDVLQMVPSPGAELISGNHLNLSCSTGGPLEADVEVKWIPPRTSSRANARPPLGPLVAMRVGTEDSGRWKCELRRNATLLTSAEITLKIEPVLTVWMLVTISGSGVILILLLALAYILLRRRQKRMRRFRHQLCQCKNPKPKGFYKA